MGFAPNLRFGNDPADAATELQGVALDQSLDRDGCFSIYRNIA
jgi:hypothetical protein